MSIRYVNFRWGLTGEWQQMEVADGRVGSRFGAQHGVVPTGEGIVDLGGRYLLPGFIDAHCHILPIGLDLKKLHLGAASTREEVLEMVRARHQSHPEGWLRAVHYNQTKFADGEHLTRADLDRISSDRPIFLQHVNGHACVVNSGALMAAGVHDATADPHGGTYRRGADGRMDGVLLERAYEFVLSRSPLPSMEQMAEAICEAGVKMAEFGITCASDMMTGCFDLDRELQAYRLAADKGCPVHMRLYLQWKCVYGRRAVDAARLRELTDAANAHPSLRVQGIKIFSDGGISSATAAIYGKYLTNDRGSKDNLAEGIETDGQLIYSPEKLTHMVQTAHDDGKQVSVHSIGDYATDLVLNAFSQTDDPKRHRIEHAMMLSDAQIERMAKIGCYCTFQPEFLLRLGPAYRRQLGDKRASMLKRSRSVLDAGIRLSFNSDRPIVGGDPWDGIRTASDRPEGFDPSENCTRLEAIEAYTAAGAAVNGDEGEMGTLAAGELVHFQVYEEDPLVADFSLTLCPLSH